MNNSGQNFAKIKVDLPVIFMDTFFPASYPQIVSFLVYFPIDFHYSFFYKKNSLFLGYKAEIIEYSPSPFSKSSYQLFRIRDFASWPTPENLKLSMPRREK